MGGRMEMINGQGLQFSNLVWLHCDLQLRGKVLVRQGKRKEVNGRWVFCPLQSGHFPHDRASIVACEKCSHFEGYSKIKVDQGQIICQYIGRKLKWKPTGWKSEQRRKIIIIVRKDVEAEIKKAVEDQRKWEEEEKKINGGSTG